VLVVDDSAFVRKVLSQMLNNSAGIEVVGTARDGRDALAEVARLQPDVVTLDLVMPAMGGVEFLREQMKRKPVPVVVCSITHESGAVALEAFEAGAVEFVQKPTALATDRVYEIADELVAKVRAAASVTFARAPVGPAAERSHITPARTATDGKSAEILVIGISTGGPQALRELIPQFDADFPVPVAIVLHMPIGYTLMYAQRLNEVSTLDVREAHEGDAVAAGTVLIAPAGKHLRLARDADGAVRCRLDFQPVATMHRPSVDVLFRSAADVYGDRVVGVVMTGMGNDGLLGAAHIKAKGGCIITEAESSCVVYGMPRAVDEAGVSDLSTPLSEMAASIREML
jgi:two-component system chemotaxis response regulator CheB